MCVVWGPNVVAGRGRGSDRSISRSAYATFSAVCVMTGAAFSPKTSAIAEDR